MLLKYKNIKKILCLFLALSLCIQNAYSEDWNVADVEQTITEEQNGNNVTQRIDTKPSDIPKFINPVALLVGISGKELSYRELSNLSGHEFFTVPYGTDVMTLVNQVNPSQVIIRHPSGFVGLYTTDGQLVRGVETFSSNTAIKTGNEIPQSIIKPVDGNSPELPMHYPGSLTGVVPHGGLGYVPPPKPPSIKRGLLKFAAFGALIPFQFPGYYRGLTVLDGESTLFGALVAPIAPHAISAAASYADSKFDEQEYNSARTQPRDYMFQPALEGY